MESGTHKPLHPVANLIFHHPPIKKQTEVTAVQDECARDLAAAEPAVAAAAAALATLDKASLGELKSFGAPSPDVVAVVAACMVLTAPAGKIPKVC